MKRVAREIIVNAPQPTVAEEIFQVDRFPGFMTDVKDVTILSRTGNRQVSSWKVDIEGVELQWIEEEELLLHPGGGAMRYRILDGDFDQFEGHWLFAADTENPLRTRISLEVYYDLGLPAFEELIGEILEIKVLRNTENLLVALKRRLDSTWASERTI